MVDKVIRDGKVAVLVSIGYGAGWYSWAGCGNENMLFDPIIVDILENTKEEDQYDAIIKHCENAYPNEYFGGIDGLTVKCVPVGAKFRVLEYDGEESLEFESDIKWITA